MSNKEAYKKLRDPFVFVEKIWGLVPQEVLPEYRKRLYECRRIGNFGKMKLEMFEPYVRWRHITWQQTEILRAVLYANLGAKTPKISIASGHGIGKSTIVAMIILWFLFVHPYAKIGCTAPTKTQMYDVLWAEIKAWLDRMPEFVKEYYEYTNDYVRIVESPENWFARARTARKESPEALAGLHADHMLILADEASGVDDEIFRSAKSALTNENTLFIMISNPTRLEGYFYESHHKLKNTFQTLSFSSAESPVVSKKFVEEIVAEHEEDSDEYRVRVEGKFPEAENVDDKGFLPLYNFEVLKTQNNTFVGEMIMGIDPAGEWHDSTIIVVRDNHKAWVMWELKKSNEQEIAELVATILASYPCQTIVYDNFGEGANLWVELMKLGITAIGVNVGDNSEDSRYLNIRAEFFWKSREWCKVGGEVSNGILEELPAIKYKNNLKNKIQIMGKEEMRRRWIKSPNKADAFMLTFYKDLKKGGLSEVLNKNNPLSTSLGRGKRQNVY